MTDGQKRSDVEERLDVNPKVGRVLIFQHRSLLHSGDVVKAGTKLTMRTDLMYSIVKQDQPRKRRGLEEELESSVDSRLSI